MGFAIAEMSFSPPLSVPITYDYWMQVTQSLDDCMASRKIEWQYSLVSVQGDRSLCVYQVPYADAVREAYREAGVAFQRIWHHNGTPTSLNHSLRDRVVVVEAHSHAAASTESAAGALAFNPFGQSVVLTDGNRTILLTATTVEAAQSHYEDASLPVSAIWQATLIQPIP